ncbi:MAG: hypothetical protein ACI8RZ_004651 [Myxococcota bacterium]|jgi:hypothetical protein
MQAHWFHKDEVVSGYFEDLGGRWAQQIGAGFRQVISRRLLRRLHRMGCSDDTPPALCRGKSSYGSALKTLHRMGCSDNTPAACCRGIDPPTLPALSGPTTARCAAKSASGSSSYGSASNQCGSVSHTHRHQLSLGIVLTVPWPWLSSPHTHPARHRNHTDDELDWFQGGHWLSAAMKGRFFGLEDTAQVETEVADRVTVS